MNAMDFVSKYVLRGACKCGKCFDAPSNPQEKQPGGHTVDLTFFKVALAEEADKQEFEKIVRSEFPQYFDGKEHSYLEVGGDIGDQDAALMLIGAGHLFGIWQALSPSTMMPFLDEQMKQQMAGMGMVSLKAQVSPLG